MDGPPSLKTLLKRGALIAAANWQVVTAQFIAETAFKILLTVPLIGGVLLVVLVVGGDVVALASGDLRSTIATVADALAARPAALALFFVALLLAVVGGAALVFFVKGGTVTVLVGADRRCPPVAWSPPGLHGLADMSGFSMEAFMDGSTRLFGRYLRLGLVLIAGYAVSGAVYLAVIYGIYQRMGDARGPLVWPVAAAACSIGLVIWIAAVNLVYVLVQIVMAADRCGVRTSVARVAALLRARGRGVIAVFAVVFGLVMLATAVSVVAAAGLSLIAFVPLAGVAVLPLQAAAWLLRGLVFQYLALTAVGAYVAQYRGFRESDANPARAGDAAAPTP